MAGRGGRCSLHIPGCLVGSRGKPRAGALASPCKNRRKMECFTNRKEPRRLAVFLAQSTPQNHPDFTKEN